MEKKCCWKRNDNKLFRFTVFKYALCFELSCDRHFSLCYFVRPWYIFHRHFANVCPTHKKNLDPHKENKDILISTYSFLFSSFLVLSWKKLFTNKQYVKEDFSLRSKNNLSLWYAIWFWSAVNYWVEKQDKNTRQYLGKINENSLKEISKYKTQHKNINNYQSISHFLCSTPPGEKLKIPTRSRLRSRFYFPSYCLLVCNLTI